MHFNEKTGELMYLPNNQELKNPCKEIDVDDRTVEEVRKSIEFGLRIEISEDVYQKVMHWVDKADFEVSGLGMVEYDKENNILRVTDAMLLKQKGSGAATEIDAAAVAKAMFLMKDKPGSLRWWWHSHVNMGVFWSGTDQATIRELGGGGWFCATVFNKKREMKSAYCQNAPVRFVIDDVECEVANYIDEELLAKWDEEFDKNVTRETFSSSSISQYGGYGAAWDNLPDEMKFKILEASDESDSVELTSDDSPGLEPEECDNFPKEDIDDNEEFERVIRQYRAKGFKFDDESKF